MPKQRLSRRLGPRAKRVFLRAREGETVWVQAEVAPGTEPEELRRAVEALGGEVRLSRGAGALLSARLPTTALAAAAEIDGVVHLETATDLHASRDSDD